jgi:hypothetical protein
MEMIRMILPSCTITSGYNLLMIEFPVIESAVIEIRVMRSPMIEFPVIESAVIEIRVMSPFMMTVVIFLAVVIMFSSSKYLVTNNWCYY